MWIINEEKSYVNCKDVVKRLTYFLSTFSWLSDSFVLEFFTENHWNKIPKLWQDTFTDIDLEEFAECLLSTKEKPLQYNKVWPLSLLSFRATAQAFALSRQQQYGLQELTELLKNNTANHNVASVQNYSHNFIPFSKEHDVQGNKCQQYLSLTHNFRRHIKPKKQHEIVCMAQIINLVMSGYEDGLIVDIGSGQGHLSRLLSLEYGYKLASIDAEGTHVHGARNLDKKVVKEIQKKIEANQRPAKGPHYIVQKISEDISGDDFLQMLADIRQVDSHNSIFALVGLHTCGNLAPTMLNIFSQCDTAIALVSVACCYMKLVSKGERETRFTGYPMSHYVTNLNGSQLSYEALEVACHANEIYQCKLKKNAASLKIHCYRATLEVVIRKWYPSKKRLGVRSVKCSETMTFAEYASLAICKLQLNIPESEFTSPYIDECMARWKHVVIYYSLRLLLAPVIETLVLLDRMLFLCEKGCHSCIFPAFEPTISPRNHVIVAIKPVASKCDNKNDNS